MTISIKITALIGVFITAGVGIWAMLSPNSLAKIVGIKPQGNQGLAEIRSMYGGLMLGLAGYILWYRTDRSFDIAGWCWAGAGIARLASMGLNKSWTIKNGLFLGLEVVTAVLFLQ